MILFFLDFLRDVCGLPLPAVFAYYSTRMLLAAVTSLGLSIFLGPRFIRKLYEMKIGQPIRKEHVPLLAQLHEKKKDTPTMGGILILFSILLAMLLWMDLTHAFTLILFGATVWLGLVGWCDDYLKQKFSNSKGLSGKRKLLFQGGFALMLAIYLLLPGASDSLHVGRWFAPPVVKEAAHTLTTQEYAARLYMPFVKGPWLFVGAAGAALVAMGLLVMLVVVGSSNAVNLTDGLDGLAAGCIIMVAGTLAVVAFVSNHIDIARYLNILYIEGSGEIAIYLSAVCGACLGFLWYNGYPAQVFMGDTGSLPLGGVIGVSAVLLKRELLLALVGGIFVAEALSVICQVLSVRFRRGKRVFLCTPVHHHFEYSGWHETKVVLRFWIIGLLLALIGLGSLKFQ